MCFPQHQFGLPFALFPDMRFYPVYRLCRSNGTFSRIGSLLETYQQWTIRATPHILKQATAHFKQKPGEIILLGPRCMPVGNDALLESGNSMEAGSSFRREIRFRSGSGVSSSSGYTRE